MNRQRFFEIISSPANLQYDSDLPLVKELIESFPYFATPHVMLSKMLHDENSIYFDKNLKLSAAYIGNREVLYHYIMDKPEPGASAVVTEMVGNAVEKETLAVAEDHEKHTSPNEVLFQEPVLASPEVELHETMVLPNESVVVVPVLADVPAPEPETLAEVFEPGTQEQVIISGDTQEETINFEISEEAAIEASPVVTPEIPEPEEVVPELIIDTPAPVEFDDLQDSEPVERLEEPIQAAETDTLPAAPITVKEMEPVSEVIPTDELLAIAQQEFYFIGDNADIQKAPEPAPEKSPVESLFPYVANDYFGQFYKNEKNKSVPEINSGDTVGNNHTFTEWFDLLETSKIKVVPEVKKEIKPPVKEKKKEVIDLIDKFIQAEPRIKPQQTRMYNPEDMAKRSAKPDFTMATETLANIFLKQGLNQKAVEIFQQLILRYPQKSGYFADKIREIQSEGHL